MKFLASTVACGALLLLSSVANANERHFTYSYESGVLPTGARELEVWTTYRRGRGDYYSALDHRMEYEVGLGRGLQTAFYVNFSGIAETQTNGEVASRFEYKGISSEWKWRLLDSVADPLGLALYGELELNNTEVEIETKAIIDKRLGDFLFVGNLVAINEWVREGAETEHELKTELDLGASYFLLPNVAFGLESRTDTEVKEGHTAFIAESAGPVLAYAHDQWWAAITALRQLPAFKKDESRRTFVYDGHERYDVRLLFSFHL